MSEEEIEEIEEKYLARRVARRGVTGRPTLISMRPKKRYGQHFLQAAWADKLVAAIDPQPDDAFLEIGPGPGALTLRLAPRVASAHRDRARSRDGCVAGAESAAERDARPGRLPRVRSRLSPVRASASGSPETFRITSPPLFCSRSLALIVVAVRFVDATLMLQREVADRIHAQPGTRDYGVLSIFVQLHADVRPLLSLPPGAFRPAPKVHSTVVLPAVPAARRRGAGRTGVRGDGSHDVHATAQDPAQCAAALRRRPRAGCPRGSDERGDRSIAPTRDAATDRACAACGVFRYGFAVSCAIVCAILRSPWSAVPAAPGGHTSRGSPPQYTQAPPARAALLAGRVLRLVERPV